MTIGQKIRKLRQEKGMTQKQLGEKLGQLSQQQIGQWETGKANPKIETLKKIAAALEINISEFLDDDYFDIATNEEPNAEENEIKFLDEKVMAIEKILKNNDITEKEKSTQLHNHIIQAEIIADMHKINVTNTNKYLLDEYFKKLNFKGQDKAIEQVEMLTKIPEYTKDDED